MEPKLCTYMPKYNELQHLLEKLFPNIWQTQICAPNQVYMPFIPNIWKHIWAGVYVYMCQMWSQLYQPCSKEHCTHICIYHWTNMASTTSVSDIFWLLSIKVWKSSSKSSGPLPVAHILPGIPKKSYDFLCLDGLDPNNLLNQYGAPTWVRPRSMGF